MDPESTTVIDTPEISELAQQFGVYSAIHQKDFIFLYHKDNPPRELTETAGIYYHVGNDSATRLLSLIDKSLAPQPSKRVSVFEFAAGYGCVSRHLKLRDRLEVVPCDIHDEAVTFIRTGLDLPAMGSTTRPVDLNPGRRFDVVFALSFFTHMPARTWTVWFEKLFSLVDDDGLFIFTTHGFKPWRDIGAPEIGERTTGAARRTRS